MIGAQFESAQSKIEFFELLEPDFFPLAVKRKLQNPAFPKETINFSLDQTGRIGLIR